MKRLIWTLLNCVVASLLIANVNCGEGEHSTFMQGSLYAQEESAHDRPSFDVEAGDGDEEDLEETGIDEASSEIVESHVPFPTDQVQGTDAEAQTPPRKTRRKRRRRRKRPRTSTHVYEEQDPTAESSARFQEPPAEGDYVDGVYVRRRPMKRRRRPVNRRPVYDELESEDVLPRRKPLRRPIANRTAEEQVAHQHWDPITSTEEAKWKPLKATTTESAQITSTKPTTTTLRITTFSPTTTQQSYVEETTKTSVGRDTKKSNSTRPDMVVVHRRPVSSNLPPTSAIIRRRLKPQNTSSEEITTTTIITTTTTTSTTTSKPNVFLIKEDVPLDLLPPGFIKPEQTTQKETAAADKEYEFDDEALSKMINQQPNDRREEPKFKSDSIPKVKDEILTLLKTKTGSSLLSNILNLRNMSLEQLLQHRERGSSQRHQQLLDDPETKIASTKPTVMEENVKNFTNYLIETKLLAQKDLGGVVGAQSTENPLLTYKTKTTKDHHYVTIYKEERVKDETIAGTKDDDDDAETINNGQRVKKMDFPTTTTFTTSLDGGTSYVSKGPKSRIISEIPDREPRLFESMPDFSTKATTIRPLVTPTVPSQVLFIQDTNHIDKSLLHGDKEINEEGLEYRRFEMRKLPAAVKSAIIASAAILAIAVLGFFVLLVSCRMRQKKRVLRKNSVYCKHNIHSDPDLRSSARSTSPVMDKPYHDPYYDGYGDRIDDRVTANRQYYLWRTLRRTFRYD